MRDNGAIEGGAAGFAEGDEVIVLKKYDSSKVYVVGHVDGIKDCIWEPWNLPKPDEDPYKINTTNDWIIAYIWPNWPSRHPFQIVPNGVLKYSIATHSLAEDDHPPDGSSVNDGIEIPEMVAGFDETKVLIPIANLENGGCKLYIKYTTTTTVSGGWSGFYIYLYLIDIHNTRLLCCLTGSNTSYIRPVLTNMGYYWLKSAPGVAVGNYNITNDGTVPILLPCLTDGISWVAIETGYDELITSELKIDYINFK